MRLLKNGTRWFLWKEHLTNKKMRSIQLIIIIMLMSISQLGLSTVDSQQQEKKITGNVTDKSGAPLPGVTVLVVGTSIGTTTDANGNFSLTIPSNAKMLSFSFSSCWRSDQPSTGTREPQSVGWRSRSSRRR